MCVTHRSLHGIYLGLGHARVTNPALLIHDSVRFHKKRQSKSSEQGFGIESRKAELIRLLHTHLGLFHPMQSRLQGLLPFTSSDGHFPNIVIAGKGIEPLPSKFQIWELLHTKHLLLGAHTQ